MTANFSNWHPASCDCGWMPQQIQARVSGMDRQRKQMLCLGQRLLSHYGCANCHSISGLAEGSTACPDLSAWGQVRTERLDFGKVLPEQVEEFRHNDSTHRLTLKAVNGLSTRAVTEIIPRTNAGAWDKPIAADVAAEWPLLENNRASWLQQKLLNPRIYNRGHTLLDPLRVGMEPSTESAGTTGQRPVVSHEQPGRPYVKLRMPCFYFNDDQVRACRRSSCPTARG